MRESVRVVDDLVAAIAPADELEARHLSDARAWLASTDDVFRRVKPVTPSPHLVSYLLIVDPGDGAVYLGDHRLSGLWLPPGGHVEPDEHPSTTARREFVEELGLEPSFGSRFGEAPAFLTVTPTRGPDRHTDVSLWFVVTAQRSTPFVPDPREYRGARWWTREEVAAAASSSEIFDPHLSRALAKVR